MSLFGTIEAAVEGSAKVSSWLNPGRWLIYGGLAIALLAGAWALYHHIYEAGADFGRMQVQAKWDQQTKERAAVRADEIQRIQKEQANHDAENAKSVARARADADRNRADADRVREQSANAAREWADLLGRSPTPEQCKAAGSAIVVQADVRSRLDSAAGQLAEALDASHSAGVLCQQQYDAVRGGR